MMDAEVVVSIVSVVLSLFALFYTWRMYHSQVEHDRKKATLDAFNLLQEQVLDLLNLYTVKDITEIAEKTRTSEYKKIGVWLARLEHFSVGVNSEIYDVSVVKRLGGKHLMDVHKKLLPMIQQKRDSSHSKENYCEFEELVIQLKRSYKNSKQGET